MTSSHLIQFDEQLHFFLNPMENCEGLFYRTYGRKGLDDAAVRLDEVLTTWNRIMDFSLESRGTARWRSASSATPLFVMMTVRKI
jgi:hypothetical protein